MTAERQVRFLARDLPASVTQLYRKLRRAGLSRHDCNLICVGVCIVASPSSVTVTRPPASQGEQQ